MKIPHHVKTASPFVAWIGANQTIETIREHFFLSAHEFLSHAKLLYISLPTTGGIAAVALLLWWFKKHEDKTDADNQKCLAEIRERDKKEATI